MCREVTLIPDMKTAAQNRDYVALYCRLKLWIKMHQENLPLKIAIHFSIFFFSTLPTLNRDLFSSPF